MKNFSFLFPFLNGRQTGTEVKQWFVGLHITSGCQRIETALIGLQGSKNDPPNILLQKYQAFEIPKEISTAFEAIQQQLMDETLENASRDCSDQRSEGTTRATQEAKDVNETLNNPTFSQTGTTIISSGPSIKQESSIEQTIPEGTNIDASCRNDSVRAEEKSGKTRKEESRNLLQELDSLRMMISAIQEEAIDELFQDCEISQKDVLLLTISDPGVWVETLWGVQHHALSDASLLAHRTGLNILDSLPDKDVAANGHGRPLSSLAHWIFLTHSETNRLLIDFGQTARLTFLPKNSQPDALSKIQVWDQIPCGNLLDLLTQQMTRGKQKMDMGGRLSVQGQAIPELIGYWHHLFQQIQSPQAVFHNDQLLLYLFLQAIEELHAREHWSDVNILCSAVHWIVETIDQRISTHILPQASSLEIILTGNTRKNGLLFNRLSALSLFQTANVVPIESLQLPEKSFEAMSTAMSGILFSCQYPMNLSHLTGADTSCLLGRLTPGPLEKWTALLAWLKNR